MFYIPSVHSFVKGTVPWQPLTNELVIGGGFHASSDVRDIVQMPSVPSVDMRLVRWTGERWGVSSRMTAGLGSTEELRRETARRV